MQLVRFAHDDPIVRYAMRADDEEILSALHPGSAFGEGFAQHMDINFRQRTRESSCFVVNATDRLEAGRRSGSRR